MKFKNSFLSSVFLLFAACFLLTAPVASAQTPDAGLPAEAGRTEGQAGLRLITSPLPISLVAEPGTIITTELKVKNGGTGSEKLKIDLMKFKAYEESGKPQLLDPEPGDDFLKWVSFSESNFTLAPDEWKTVTVTFTVPETASFGYYYAFVFSRDQDLQALDSSQTAIVGGTAVLVLLEVRVADAKREVEVADFSSKKFYEFLPATFNVTLKNTGNVHIAPRGNIFIDQGDTHDIAILEVNKERGSILPDSSRIFDTSWTDGFPVFAPEIKDGKNMSDDEGNPLTKISWNWNDASKLRFGKYQAKLLLIYDDGHRDVPIEGEISFWVVPWRMILALLAVTLFFFIGIRSTTRNIWRKIFKKSPSSV